MVETGVCGGGWRLRQVGGGGGGVRCVWARRCWREAGVAGEVFGFSLGMSYLSMQLGVIFTYLYTKKIYYSIPKRYYQDRVGRPSPE